MRVEFQEVYVSMAVSHFAARRIVKTSYLDYSKNIRTWKSFHPCVNSFYQLKRNARFLQLIERIQLLPICAILLTVGGNWTYRLLSKQVAGLNSDIQLLDVHI